MKRSLKKASLSLSINAVVILVLAIAMLGLGLGFTKKMFSKFGDTLSIPEPELTATESDPIVLVSDQIEIKPNKDASLPIRYFSVGGSDNPNGIYPHISCINGTNTIQICGSPQPISSGAQKTYRILIPAGTVSNSVVCTVQMVDDDPAAPCGAPTATEIDDSKQVTFIPSG